MPQRFAITFREHGRLWMVGVVAETGWAALLLFDQWVRGRGVEILGIANA